MQVFKYHWYTEFSEETSLLALGLECVLAMEDDLNQCQQHLHLLKGTLAEKQFKVAYLEVVLAQGKRGAG